MNEIEKLAKNCNVSVSTVYLLCQKYGRLVTEDEINGRNIKRGRPKKYNRQKKV